MLIQPSVTSLHQPPHVRTSITRSSGSGERRKPAFGAFALERVEMCRHGIFDDLGYLAIEESGPEAKPPP